MIGNHCVSKTTPANATQEGFISLQSVHVKFLSKLSVFLVISPLPSEAFARFT
jgi:hypothetical protein